MATTGQTQMSLGSAPDCARQAREAVVEMCEGLQPDIAEIAQLLVSEVVTNALQHGDGPIELTVTRSQDTLHISVDDDGPQTPYRLPVNRESTHGRGLILVERLATDWGVTQRDPGKSVWFDLRMT